MSLMELLALWLLLLIGLGLVVYGAVIWFGKKMNWITMDRRRDVSEKYAQPFTRGMGQSFIIIGFGLAVCALCCIFGSSRARLLGIILAFLFMFLGGILNIRTVSRFRRRE